MYYQVPLSERAKKISAFTTPFGLYEFQRLPFGLVNAPMTFQRLMDCCLSDMNLAELIIFLDDILVHGSNLQQLEDRTIRALERLRIFKLKLDPDKCIFATTEVRHLGYLVSAEGIRPDPEKIEVLTKPILGIADQSQPFILHCDASGTGLGAVLYQHQQGKLKQTARNTTPMSRDNDVTDNFSPAVEAVVRDPNTIPDGILEPEGGEQDFATLTVDDWRRLQQQDPHIAAVCQALTEGTDLTVTGPETRIYARERKSLMLEHGVLYRRVSDATSTRVQLVVPRSMRQEAMRGVHDELYHTHFDDAIRHARMRFFWPFMAADLKRKIQSCERCVRSGTHAQKAPMSTIVTSHPLELLTIDFLTIEVKGEKQNILVIMDHFTKFVQAILTKDQTARTTARALWNDFFMTYGFPGRILSDQGRDFESKLIQELCSLAGIEKCRTTPCYPCGNPVERWNRTLISMLRTLETEQKKDWRKHLKSVVHAYNSCIHSSTGFSPSYLFYGRYPRLPVDLCIWPGHREATREELQAVCAGLERKPP
ncbi:uncharacterized protein K02A2.6-like [Pomacea canaliculata]|uniref:uncharacterized protein K02A2.6-like n=1 Tax=Pomacea canaliculata TaxID=400727 RepID=UPI000D73E7C2|nr:uncharacterized protein K02A2.6-like [Pomacea canaliculata]